MFDEEQLEKRLRNFNSDKAKTETADLEEGIKEKEQKSDNNV